MNNFLIQYYTNPPDQEASDEDEGPIEEVKLTRRTESVQESPTRRIPETALRRFESTIEIGEN